MARELPAALRVWVECPKCGRYEKLARDFRLPLGVQGDLLHKIAIQCEYCEQWAYMYLQRLVSQIH
jgi:hypothetical protein